MIVSVPCVFVKQMVKITVDPQYTACRNRTEERCFEFLNQAEIEFRLKDQLYEAILREKEVSVLAAELNSMNLNQDLYGALLEILTAR